VLTQLKLDPYCQRQKCSRKILVFGTICFTTVDVRFSTNFVQKLTHHHLFTIRVVQHCMAISATAELLCLNHSTFFIIKNHKQCTYCMFSFDFRSLLQLTVCLERSRNKSSHRLHMSAKENMVRIWNPYPYGLQIRLWTQISSKI